MEDWAETRAREFCNERWPSQRVEADDLAALLREVRQEAAGVERQAVREVLLAEVRRLVQGVQDKAKKDWGGGGDRWAEVNLYTDEILSRLEKL